MSRFAGSDVGLEWRTAGTTTSASPSAIRTSVIWPGWPKRPPSSRPLPTTRSSDRPSSISTAESFSPVWKWSRRSSSTATTRCGGGSGGAPLGHRGRLPVHPIRAHGAPGRIRDVRTVTRPSPIPPDDCGNQGRQPPHARAATSSGNSVRVRPAGSARLRQSLPSHSHLSRSRTRTRKPRTPRSVQRQSAPQVRMQEIKARRAVMPSLHRSILALGSLIALA